MVASGEVFTLWEGAELFFGVVRPAWGGHELVTLLFTLLPRWAVSASFRPLETLSFENAAPVALR